MKSFFYSILFTLALTFSMQTFADQNDLNQSEDKANIFLSYCSHFGSGVSYTFSSCVNSNFQNIASYTRGFYPSCTNFSQEVDYFFTSCINSNFRSAARELGNSIYLSDCMNFDRKTLDFSFISCVNSNFNSIQREISRRP